MSGTKVIMDAIRKMDENINSRIDTLEKQSNTILTEFRLLQEDVNNLTKNQNKMREELLDMNIELNTLKQNAVNSDVIITGIHEVKDEKLLDVVNKVLQEYKLVLRNTDYNSIYRMKNKSDTSKFSPICIEFYSGALKGAIIKQQKILGPVLLHMIDKSLPETDLRKIYFKDRLIKYNMELLKAARRFKADNNYKFVWYQNSDVLLKKNETSQCVKIRSPADLVRLGLSI